MRHARRMLGVLLFVLVAAVGVNPIAGAATPTSSPDPLAWFETSGLSVVRSHAGEDLSHLSANQLNQLKLGTPVRAYTFTEHAGRFNPSDLWVTPVLVENKPVATLATEFTSGESQREKVTAESRFATALTELSEDSLVVVEPGFGGRDNLGGWFLVSGEGTVAPLDPVARSVLAGEVTMESFQEIRTDLLAGKDPVVSAVPTEKEDSGTGGIIRTAVVLVILLVVVGLLVWVRHDHVEPQGERKGERRRERGPRSRPVPDDVKILERPRSRRDKLREHLDEEPAHHDDGPGRGTGAP